MMSIIDPAIGITASIILDFGRRKIVCGILQYSVTAVYPMVTLCYSCILLEDTSGVVEIDTRVDRIHCMFEFLRCIARE